MSERTHWLTERSLRLWVSLSLSFCLSIHLSIYLSFFLKHLKHLKHLNRSNSARLPQKMNVHSSKTQQVCDTSSKSESSQLQNHEILRDFFKFGNWHRQIRSNSARLPFWRVQTWQPRANAFGDFSIPCPESIAPPKSDARSYGVLHLSRQNHLTKAEDLMLQNATFFRKSAPGPPNMSDAWYSCVSCTARATRNASLQILFKRPICHCFSATKVSLWQWAESNAPATNNAHSTSKSVRRWCVLTTKQNFPNWLTGLLSGFSSLLFLDMQTWICTVYIRIHARLETKSSSTLHTYSV